MFELIKKQLPGIAGVLVALMALEYSIWRSELSESNANIRKVAFRVLDEIDALDELLFSKGDENYSSAFSLVLHRLGRIENLLEVMPEGVRAELKESLNYLNKEKDLNYVHLELHSFRYKVVRFVGKIK